MCDYVHLNPVRAHLLAPEEPLSAYPWSSLHWYAAARQHRPSWIRVDRLLGEHGLRADNPAARARFLEQMEQRRTEQPDDDALKHIRRGWCFGSNQFREEMLDLIDEDLHEDHPATPRQQSSQSRADRIITEELSRLKWKLQDLLIRRKNDPQKLAIAARLRKETTLTIKEIASRLALGTSKGANATLHKFMNQTRRKAGPLSRRKFDK